MTARCEQHNLANQCTGKPGIAPRRVLYSGIHPHLHPAIEHLATSRNWQPVALNCGDSSRGWASGKYPQALVTDEMALRKGQFDYSRIGPAIPVDAGMIAALALYESTCLNHMEDVSGWEFSFDERRRYYHELLTYWSTMLQRARPEIFVAFNWPHTHTAYSLYLLCKYYFRIDVLFVDPMPLMNSRFSFIGTSMEDFSLSFKEVYESRQPLELGAEARAYLEWVRADRWQTAKVNQEDMQRWERQRRFQYREFLRVLYYLVTGRAFQESHVAWKKNRAPFESAGSRLNHFEHFWFRDRLRRRDTALEPLYLSFCEEPDFKCKYLYFASAQQPEATTAINAQVYDDIHLVLRILSASVPKDWVIYYKEHSGNFYPTLKGSLKRDRLYYEKIRSLGNVKMVSHRVDSFKLIDHSTVVATAAGTSSWEAVVRGKPGLFFGNVWYQGCHSLLRVMTLQDCQEAIRRVMAGYVPDQNDLERYLAAIERVGFKSFIRWSLVDDPAKCLGFQGEIERIADALYQSYERYYSNGEGK